MLGDFPRYYPSFNILSLTQDSREDFTVMSRILFRCLHRNWQFNYQTRNFASSLLFAWDHIFIPSNLTGAWRMVSEDSLILNYVILSYPLFSIQVFPADHPAISETSQHMATIGLIRRLLCDKATSLCTIFILLELFISTIVLVLLFT